MKTYADHLRTLNVTASATQDDIKSAYRSLVKKYHPDVGGSENKFREITDSYEWLQRNHKPAYDDRYDDFYYRILNDEKDYHTISLPIRNIATNTTIRCMKNGREFNIRLDKGITLPKTLMLKVYGEEFRVNIVYNEPSWR